MNMLLLAKYEKNHNKICQELQGMCIKQGETKNKATDGNHRNTTKGF